MIDTRIDIDLRPVLGFIDLLGEESRKAIAGALNDSAFASQQALRENLGQIFNAPSKFVQNAPVYIKATPDKLAVAVLLRNEAPKGNAPSEILAPHMSGGSRKQTRFEQSLAAVGIISSSEFAIAAKGTKFGRGVATRILSSVQANRDSLQNSHKVPRLTKKYLAGLSKDDRKAMKRRARSAKRNAFFAVKVNKGKLKRGIWQRIGKDKVKPIAITVKSVNYRARFDFAGIVLNTFALAFAASYRRRFEKAVDTSAFRRAA